MLCPLCYLVHGMYGRHLVDATCLECKANILTPNKLCSSCADKKGACQFCTQTISDGDSYHNRINEQIERLDATALRVPDCDAYGRFTQQFKDFRDEIKGKSRDELLEMCRKYQ
jgi:hypothetical protein